MALAFRRPGASAANPATVEIRGGTTPITVRIASDEWQYVTLRLARNVLAIMRAAHRVDLDVSRYFVPAVLDPKSSDLRRFGVQLHLIDFQRWTMGRIGDGWSMNSAQGCGQLHADNRCSLAATVLFESEAFARFAWSPANGKRPEFSAGPLAHPSASQ
jgi:hypothetical protein